ISWNSSDRYNCLYLPWRTSASLCARPRCCFAGEETFKQFCTDSFRTLAFFAGRATYCLLSQCRRGGIGRRAGLKIQYWQQCVGSTPGSPPSVGRTSALDEILLLELELELELELVLVLLMNTRGKFLTVSVL